MINRVYDEGEVKTTDDFEYNGASRGKVLAAPHGSSPLSAAGGAELPERPMFWEHGTRRAVYQDCWKLVAEGRVAP